MINSSVCVIPEVVKCHEKTCVLFVPFSDITEHLFGVTGSDNIEATERKCSIVITNIHIK